MTIVSSENRHALMNDWRDNFRKVDAPGLTAHPTAIVTRTTQKTRNSVSWRGGHDW
jgi:hypothetical protein